MSYDRTFLRPAGTRPPPRPRSELTTDAQAVRRALEGLQTTHADVVTSMAAAHNDAGSAGTIENDTFKKFDRGMDGVCEWMAVAGSESSLSPLHGSPAHARAPLSHRAI